MITVHLRHHIRGASPHSDLPLVILELKGRKQDATQLMQKRAILAQSLQDTPRKLKQPRGMGLIRKLIGATDPVLPEEWLQHWLVTLLESNGIPQYKQAPVCSAPKSTGSDEWVLLIPLHYLQDSLAPLNQLLTWSCASWNSLVSVQDEVKCLALLGSAPLSRSSHKQKQSYQALAKSLISRGDFFTEINCDGVPMLRVGYGAGQRCFSEMVSEKTSGMGIQSTRNKHQAKLRLHQANLPVAPGIEVSSYKAVLESTLRIGFPVVTKPVDCDQGAGVVTGIANERELEKAWEISVRESARVLVEKHITGRDFRFWVVKGELIAALERIPGGVTGDGILSVRELVLKENQQRKQQPVSVEGGGLVQLAALEINQEAEDMLRKQGLDLDARPMPGQFVALRYGANFSLGGSVRECLAEVALVNRFLIEKAARTFNLDIAGIDVIAPSIDRCLIKAGGVICEVNSMPGVLPHMVAEPNRQLMDELAQRMLQGRIEVPLVGILGENTGGIISAIERVVTPKVSTLIVSDRSGLRQGGVVLSEHNGCTFSLQRRAVQDPSAAAIMLELERGELMRQGLPWPRFNLLILNKESLNGMPDMHRQWLCNSTAHVIQLDPSSPESCGKAIEAARACLSKVH